MLHILSVDNPERKFLLLRSLSLVYMYLPRNGTSILSSQLLVQEFVDCKRIFFFLNFLEDMSPFCGGH